MMIYRKKVSKSSTSHFQIMPENLVRVLKQLKTFQASNTSQKLLNIVCGNESADLDSIVSTLAYAYFSYIHDPSKYILPVVNIPRQDLKLRKDVTFLLGSHSISSDLLNFREDLVNWQKQSLYDINYVLVDHNDVPAITNDGLTNIAGIIDHHKDLGLHAESITKLSGPRIIQTAGSCSTLVFQYWNGILKHDSNSTEMVKEIVPLLLGALLLDTDNMKNKVEPVDQAVFEQYKRILGSSFNTDSFYQQLRTAKDDINGLSINDILRKDYKEFRFASNVRCGIASVVKSLEWINEQYGEDSIENACEKFMTEHSLDIFIIMNSFTRDGTFSKQIAFISENDSLLNELFKDLIPKLQLESIRNVSKRKLKCYRQGNVKASRKQVAPYVQESLEKYQ